MNSTSTSVFYVPLSFFSFFVFTSSSSGPNTLSVHFHNMAPSYCYFSLTSMQNLHWIDFVFSVHLLYIYICTYIYIYMCLFSKILVTCTESIWMWSKKSDNKRWRKMKVMQKSSNSKKNKSESMSIVSTGERNQSTLPHIKQYKVLQTLSESCSARIQAKD